MNGDYAIIYGKASAYDTFVDEVKAYIHKGFEIGGFQAVLETTEHDGYTETDVLFYQVVFKPQPMLWGLPVVESQEVQDKLDAEVLSKKPLGGGV